jgi:hypothetical protein
MKNKEILHSAKLGRRRKEKKRKITELKKQKGKEWLLQQDRTNGHFNQQELIAKAQ